MSQLLVELCYILIEEKLGERIASLWQHIADVGRLTFKDLLASSSVPQYELPKLLTVLLQHRCITYYTDEEYDSAYYTVDVEGAYNLMRLSRVVGTVRKRYGADAAGLMANIAQFGQITVASLTRLYQLHVPNKTIDQVHGTIMILLRAGFLIRAQPHFSQNSYDLEQELENRVMEEEFHGQRVTGPVSSRKFKEAVDSRKRRQHEADFANEEYAFRDTRHANKKRKLDLPNGHAHAGLLPDDLILFVNAKKYMICLRSEHLERKAATALGSTASGIYGALLRTLEHQIHDIKRVTTTTAVNYDSDEEDNGVVTAPTTSTLQPRTTAMEMTDSLPSQFDYSASMKVASKDLPRRHANGHKPAQKIIIDEDDYSNIGIKAEPGSDDEGSGDEFADLANRAKLYELVNSHLDLLAEHPWSFCTKSINKNPPEWFVDFPTLTDKILLAEIDQTITARFGSMATRLVRLLRDKGKLEEKQIAQLSYMPVKDVRTILTDLFANGFVDAQEVAKDATRQPSKALYLWYFDLTKVRSQLLQRCYQAMCRAYQRMATEREKYANILSKNDDFIRDKLAEGRAPYLHVDEDDATQAYLHEDTHANGTIDAEPLDQVMEYADDAQANGMPSSETVMGDAEGGYRNGHSQPNGTSGSKRAADEHQGDNDIASASQIDLRARSKFVLGRSAASFAKDFSNSFGNNTTEKQQIREWREKEALFINSILRLDDMVVILRDF